jgi:alpha-glucosidase (family GH31 glycosyl hydrolase)
MPMDNNLQTGCVQGDRYRISVLTDRLIRLEYSENGTFEDRPTQAVVSRAFPPMPFRLWRSERSIELHTQNLIVFYDEKPFSPSGLRIENRSACAGIYCTWRYGDQLTENLGGTARTLDEADGAVALEDGLLSRLQGYSVVDDSRSWILLKNGWMEPRAEGVKDLYFFGYGFAYREALADFFRLCGKTPLLPRFALGNWWSRYHAYSAEKYLALMDRFTENQIPLSVSVIDMDWHVTKPIDGGKGWTGYTWNKDLVPQPALFLGELHRRGLKNTLNLHPAEGVQTHEAAYPKMAAALEKDAENMQRIPFKPSDPDYLEAYFRVLHHPLEAEGVDFWWIDWQQGKGTCENGLDPLWILNHFHFQDIARGGKRPLILSRYAGVGSHRFPVGFSGDSVISWKSLAFQPYFTATASNIGFGWWSHDIGGHAYGSRDDDLQVRWLQFGVFSPILRLHSSSSVFNRKEPWMYDGAVKGIMVRFLQLRHRLVPYLYSMNYRCHAQDELLIQPLYYAYPEQPQAYTHPNQYFFGDSLIVCPITAPLNDELRMAGAALWLPEGMYFDFFTGVRYGGNCEMKMYRTLETIPVLAKAGAIIPMTEATEARQNGAALPSAFEIRVYGGADGKHRLYEDDGETQAYQNGDCAPTDLSFVWRDHSATRFTLHTAVQKPWLPARREFTVSFIGVVKNTLFNVILNGQELTDVHGEYDARMHRLSVCLRDIPCDSDVEIIFPQGLALAENDVAGCCYEILNRAQISYEQKDRVYGMLKAGLEQRAILHNLSCSGLSCELFEALLEIILA